MLIFDIEPATLFEEIEAPTLPLRKKRSRRSSKQEQNQSSFQFVNVTEQPHLNAHDRFVIRSQAMRSLLRTDKESVQAETEVGTNPPPRDRTSGTTQHRFRLGPWGIQELAVKPRKPKARRKPPGPAAGIQMSFDRATTPKPENAPKQSLLLSSAGVPSPTHGTFYPRSFDGGTVDPFDSLPIPTSERIQFLLNYCELKLPRNA